MGKFVIMFFFLAKPLFASDFTKACPAQNLDVVCKELSKIGPGKTLVFKDGTELPSCMLLTMSAEEKKLADTERALLFNLYDFIKGKVQPIELGYLSRLFREPQVLVDLESKFPEIRQIASSLRAARKQRDDSNGSIEISIGNLENEYEDTKKAVAKATEGLFTSEFANIKPDHWPKEGKIKVNCRDSGGASLFGRNDNIKIDLEDHIIALPPLSRRAVVVHELAHSFSPCHLSIKKNLPVSSNPFVPLMQCLANDVGYFRTNKNVCEDGQALEAFCDHVAAAVVANEIRSIKPHPPLAKNSLDKNKVFMPAGYESIFFYINTACGSGPDRNDSLTHPSTRRRLTEIWLKNPIIANSLGCTLPEGTPYCDMKEGLKKTPLLKKDFGNKKSVR